MSEDAVLLHRKVLDRLRNRVAVLSGTAELIAADTTNLPNARAKARTIIRVSEELVAELEGMLGAEQRTVRSCDAHLGARNSE